MPRTNIDRDRDDATADLVAIEESFGVLRNEPIDIDRHDGERGAHLERIAACACGF
ncbi:MAG: hypothetical protein ACRDPW_00890 [Mycobacteriales bacterium]